MASSAEALNVPNYSHLDILTVKERHDAFVKEAFIYLLDYFGIQAKTDGEFRFFKETTGRAIITISYTYRRRLRTYFKNAQINLGDINEFQKIVGHFEVIRDKSYFFRTLRRISHVFEFTIFCLKEGYDYIETAREIFSIDDDTVFFENNGGLDRLNETGSFISEVGDVFYTVIQEENPQDIVLKSFVKAVENLERPNRDSMLVTHKGLLSTLKNEAVKLLENIHGVDPRVLQVFYRTVIQHSSKVFVLYPENAVVEYKLDIGSEKTAIIKAFEALLEIVLGDWKKNYLAGSMSIKLAGYFVIFRHLSDLISTELEDEHPEYELWTQSPYSPQNCYSLKEYYLVSYDYIQKTKFEQRNIIPKDEYADLAIEPSVKNMFITKLRRIVDANIEQTNYFQLMNDRIVVYTPDCKFDDNTTCIVVNEYIKK